MIIQNATLSKQYIGIKNTKAEQKFNPVLMLIGLAGTGSRSAVIDH